MAGPKRKLMKLIRLRRADRLAETPVTLPGRGIKPLSVIMSSEFYCFSVCNCTGIVTYGPKPGYVQR